MKRRAIRSGSPEFARQPVVVLFGERRVRESIRHAEKSNDTERLARGQSVDEQLRKLEDDYANEKRNREMELFRKDQELKTTDLERREAVQAGVIIALVSVLIIGLLLVNRYQVIAKARRRAEIETMRNAIAQDLHDDIGSTLSSINILSQLAIRETNLVPGTNAVAGSIESYSKHFSKIAEQIEPHDGKHGATSYGR